MDAELFWIGLGSVRNPDSLTEQEVALLDLNRRVSALERIDATARRVAPEAYGPGSGEPAVADTAEMDAFRNGGTRERSDGTTLVRVFAPHSILCERALLDVACERIRQIEAEGHTFLHDDLLTDQQLTHLAIRYLNSGAKPYRRRLVIAAALLLAEIERLDRSVTGGAAAEQKPMPFAHGAPTEAARRAVYAEIEADMETRLPHPKSEA
ncbi:MAG: hypothetical protein WA210_09040 [Burkholderiaceae bacterium]